MNVLSNYGDFKAERYREEAPYKIHGGCGLAGICDESGKRMSGEIPIGAICIQHDRGNGLGGGFAGYGIYPDFPDHFAFHLMYNDRHARDETEEYLHAHFTIDQQEIIPTRRMREFIDAPELIRYFATVPQEHLDHTGLTEDDYVVQAVMHVNATVDGAFVASSGRNMGAFKGVGYPEDIGHFFKLEEYEAYTWITHNRFPTNTPGWWGGAHPFTLLDWAIVHNGEISSYGTNRRYLEQFGYICSLGTDTEVAAYLFDLLLRRHKLPVEYAAKVLAAPQWAEIERIATTDPDHAEILRALRTTYAPAMLNGPFAMILGFRDGMLAINDRLKLRPLVAARKGSIVMVASEEASILEVLPSPDRLYSPRAGEPVIARVKGVHPTFGSSDDISLAVDEGFEDRPPAVIEDVVASTKRGVL